MISEALQKTLKKIKGSCAIYHIGDRYVIRGKYFWIITEDGEILTCRKDIFAVKAVSLPGNKVLIDSETTKKYIVFSLEDGSEVLQIEQPKHFSQANRFAISSDGRYVYDIIARRTRTNERSIFVTIDLDAKNISTYAADFRGAYLKDIICDENDVPCALEGHYQETNGIELYCGGIRYHGALYGDHNVADSWKYQWTLHDRKAPDLFLYSTEKILLNDYCVYEPSSGKSYSLLENGTSDFLKGKHTPLVRMDPSGRYLYATYVLGYYVNASFVIDIFARKVVAQYVTEMGLDTVVDDCVLISSEDGILVKPFPAFEDLPAPKPIFAWDHISGHYKK